MANYIAQIYKEVLESISNNFFIEDIDDYSIFDASFITRNFRHIKFKKDFLQLGIYRVSTSRMGFYCAPYLHMQEVRGDYEPSLVEIPQKKSFLQKIKLVKSPKPEYRISHKYKASLSIDGLIPENLTAEIPSPIQHTILDNWYGDGIWEIFILDNLKFMLPAFGPGAYRHRTFITSSDDLLKLPKEVSKAAFNLPMDLMPAVEYKNGMAIITICYFNDWEGLIQWKLRYSTCCDTNEPVALNRVIYPADEQNVLVKYRSSTRY